MLIVDRGGPSHLMTCVSTAVADLAAANGERVEWIGGVVTPSVPTVSLGWVRQRPEIFVSRPSPTGIGSRLEAAV